jgi:hypothetical protein
MAARILSVILILFMGGPESLRAESAQVSGQERVPSGMMPAIVEKDLPRTGPRYEGALDIRIHGEEDRLNRNSERIPRRLLRGQRANQENDNIPTVGDSRQLAAGIFNPPAELLLVDPEGRRTGKDPRTGRTFSEMPNAFYEHEGIADLESGAPGPETGIVYVRNPVSGEFTLKVIGKEPFPYVLEARGYDCEMGYSGAMFDHVGIHENAEHIYLIKYSNEEGGRVEVTRIPPLSP